MQDGVRLDTNQSFVASATVCGIVLMYHVTRLFSRTPIRVSVVQSTHCLKPLAVLYNGNDAVVR